MKKLLFLLLFCGVAQAVETDIGCMEGMTFDAERKMCCGPKEQNKPCDSKDDITCGPDLRMCHLRVKVKEDFEIKKGFVSTTDVFSISDSGEPIILLNLQTHKVTLNGSHDKAARAFWKAIEDMGGKICEERDSNAKK